MKRAVSSWAVLVPVAFVIWAQIFISGIDYVSNNSWWFVRLLSPSPYRDVQIVQLNKTGPWVNIQANFIKSQCHKDGFKAVGEASGVLMALEWYDADGRVDDESREPGRQTLTGRIFVGNRTFDYVEIRTRHICDGQTEIVDGVTSVRGGVVVDEVFARFDPELTITPDSPVSGHEAYIGPKGGY